MNEIAAIANYQHLIVDLLKQKKNADNLAVDEIEQIRQVIDAICDLGIIKTHPIISSMIKEFIFYGSMKPYTIKELENNCPWKWDQISYYLSILEKNGILTFARDEAQNKTCKLNLEDKSATNKCILKLFEYYTNYYKKNNFTQENIERCFKLVSHLFLLREKLNEIKREFETQKLEAASKEKLSEFAEEIAKASLGFGTESCEEPTFGILKVLMKNPLLMRGITGDEI